jgi:hypothetical protein
LMTYARLYKQVVLAKKFVFCLNDGLIEVKSTFF